MATASTPPWDQFSLTAGLEASQVERLTPIATPRDWAAGTSIYREGDQGSPLYLVETGRVAIEVVVPGRGPVIIMTVGPGDVFGWSSLFRDRPKSAAARTTASTRAWAVDPAPLRALCDADPVLGYALTRRLIEVISERLKASRIQLIDVFRG